MTRNGVMLPGTPRIAVSRRNQSCPHRPRPGRRSPLGHRGELRDQQRPNWIRSLSSTAIHRLVPAHHPLHARARFPDRDPVKKRGQQPGPSDLIALSLPEIRHLLDCLIFTQLQNPEHVLSRSRWRIRHQQTKNRTTTEPADIPHKRDCSTKERYWPYPGGISGYAALVVSDSLYAHEGLILNFDSARYSYKHEQ